MTRFVGKRPRVSTTMASANAATPLLPRKEDRRRGLVLGAGLLCVFGAAVATRVRAPGLHLASTSTKADETTAGKGCKTTAGNGCGDGSYKCVCEANGLVGSCGEWSNGEDTLCLGPFSEPKLK